MGSPKTAPAALARRVAAAHDQFVLSGTLDGAVRPLVAASWRRCASSGVNPDVVLPPVDLLDDELEAYREAHPLAGSMPIIRRLLIDAAGDAGLIVAVTDADGRLLWVEGEPALRSRAESMHFVAGASWRERDAGTNAPGTAIALDRAVQIFASEHFARNVKPWSCSAAPIHDPDTGLLLGALDLTGGDHVAEPQSLALVRATVAAVESELRVQRLRAPSARSVRPARPGVAALSVLGVDRGLLTLRGQRTRLSLRHSELLLLLAEHPEGRTADQLAVALHEHEGAPVTVRAELSRLRSIVAGLGLRSRPYRLERRLHTDLADVRRYLTAGALRRAIDAYPGPLLPRSDAPAVRGLRDELHAAVRAALLARGDAALLLAAARTDAGRLDLGLWTAAGDALPPDSPRRAEVAGHLAWLRAELQ